MRERRAWRGRVVIFPEAEIRQDSVTGNGCTGGGQESEARWQTGVDGCVIVALLTAID